MKKQAIALAMLLCFSAHAEEQTLASILINGTPVSSGTVLTTEGDVITLSREEWRALGVVAPENLTSDRITSKDLGLGVVFDSERQEYNLRVPSALLPMQTLSGGRPLDTDLNPSPRGVMLGYDLAVSASKAGGVKASLAHDARMNVAGGTLYHSGQLNSDTGYVRGLTTWQKDLFAKGLTVQVGDVFTTPRNSALHGTVNLGGVRVGTDRGLRSEAMYPVPVLAGLAETRSTAELLLNESRAQSASIEAGPYQFQNVYVNSGFQTVAVVVRDQYGRESIVRSQLYAMPSMVKKGGVEWDAQLGKIRQGQSGSNYGQTAFAGNIGYGLSNNWTLTGTVQATALEKNIGVGSIVSMGRAGALSLDYAKSTNGQAYSVAYQRRVGPLSLQASHTEASEHYWSLRDETGRGNTYKPKAETSAGVAFTKGNIDASVSYAKTEVWGGRRTEDLSARVRYQATPRDDISVALTRDLRSKESIAYVGWRHDFGAGLSGQITHKTGPDPLTVLALQGRAKLGQVPVQYGMSTDGKHHYMGATAEFSKATLSADLTNQGARLGASGGLWVGEGGVIATRRSYGSYVVASVGVAGAHVDASGTQATTNKKGVAVIPNVGALAKQPVTVDVATLPPEVLFDSTEEEATAPRGGGAKVTFPIRTMLYRQYRASWNGTPIEDIGTVTTESEKTIMAEQGRFVLEQPKAGLTVRIKWKDGTCSLLLPELSETADDVTEVVCKEDL